MKSLFTVVLAGLATATAPAMAADLFGSAPPPMTFPAADGPTAVEIGSSWYIRGDIGMSWDQVPSISINNQSVPPAGNATTPIGVNEGETRYGRNLAADVGVGYQFNNYFRMDATYEYRNGSGASGQNTVVCPYSAYGLTNQKTGYTIGIAYDTSDTCNGELNVNQWNNMFLGNAYFDLGSYYGVTPYVGAGAGLNVNSTSGSLDYFETANGQLYAADLTAPSGYPLIWVNPKTGVPITPGAQSFLRTAGLEPQRPIDALRLRLRLDGGRRHPAHALGDPGPRLPLPGHRRDLDRLQHAGQQRRRQGIGQVSQEIRVGIRYAIQ